MVILHRLTWSWMRAFTLWADRCEFNCGARAWCNVTMLVSRVINLKVSILLSASVINDGWWLLSVCSLMCVFECTLIYRDCVLCVRLLFIDTEFQTLRLKAEDPSGRQHVLTIKLKSKVLVLLHTPKLDDLVKIIRHQWNNLQPIHIQAGQLHQMHIGCSICR